MTCITLWSTAVFAYTLSGHEKVTEKALEFISIQEIQQFRDNVIAGASGSPALLRLDSEDLDPVPGPLRHKTRRWARTYNHGYNPFVPADRQAWPSPRLACPNDWKFKWDVMTAKEWANTSKDKNYFTWDNAIKLYKSGKKERAYHIIGHIVHLVEDMSIPAHVHIIDHGIHVDELMEVLASTFVPTCIKDFYPGFFLPDALEDYLSNDPDALLCCKATTPQFNAPEQYIKNLAIFTHNLGTTIPVLNQTHFFLDDGEEGNFENNGFGIYDIRGGLGLAGACDAASSTKPVCEAFARELYPQVVAYVVGLLELFWQETHQGQITTPAVLPTIWRASPISTSCTGPTDARGRDWTNPRFKEPGWTTVTLPDTPIAGIADRFYRGHFTLANPPPDDVKLFFYCDDGCEISLNGGPLVGFGNGTCHTLDDPTNKSKTGIVVA